MHGQMNHESPASPVVYIIYMYNSRPDFFVFFYWFNSYCSVPIAINFVSFLARKWKFCHCDLVSIWRPKQEKMGFGIENFEQNNTINNF
jgi:hypothetical protein